MNKKKKETNKRQDYLSWDDYFMGVAVLSGLRSKDPNTQVGACIVNQHKRVVGIGYNGFPRGCSDDEFPWTREGDFLETKYPYVVHAEQNAILNSNNTDLRGSKLYVALFPCNECAKVIIQKGIDEVIYISDKYADNPNFIAAKKMLLAAKVKMRIFKPQRKEIRINLGLD
jgi:dCMP deaminase